MIRGFIEYKVDPQYKDTYTHIISQIRRLSLDAGVHSYSVAESVDQENLYVETILVRSLEEYQAVEAKLSKNPTMIALREQLDAVIVGGSQAKKMWFFTELQFS